MNSNQRLEPEALWDQRIERIIMKQSTAGVYSKSFLWEDGATMDIWVKAALHLCATPTTAPSFDDEPSSESQTESDTQRRLNITSRTETCYESRCVVTVSCLQSILVLKSLITSRARLFLFLFTTQVFFSSPNRSFYSFLHWRQSLLSFLENTFWLWCFTR